MVIDRHRLVVCIRSFVSGKSVFCFKPWVNVVVNLFCMYVVYRMYSLYSALVSFFSWIAAVLKYAHTCFIYLRQFLFNISFFGFAILNNLFLYCSDYGAAKLNWTVINDVVLVLRCLEDSLWMMTSMLLVEEFYLSKSLLLFLRVMKNVFFDESFLN